MAKKLGKLIIFGAAIGATAAGVYHYLQNKNNVSDEFDDFDDFDNIDDFDDIEDDDKKYVVLDTAKAFVADTLDKAKDVIAKASKKLKNNDEDAFFDLDSTVSEDNDTVLSDDNVKEEASVQTKNDEAEEASTASDEVANNIVGKSTEDFFDDDEA